MGISTVLSSIQSTLEAASLVDSNAISLSANSVTYGSLENQSLDTPQLFIHCTGFGEDTQAEDTDLVGYDLTVTANFTVSATIRNRDDSHETIRLLCETIMLILVDQDWGLDSCLTPYDRICQPVFSTDTSQQNIYIWAVSWSQTVGLSKTDVASELVDWERYHADTQSSDDTEQTLMSADVELTSS